MMEALAAGRRPARVAVKDCWNTIGVRGDRSCPELRQHVHCRNCPVYAAGAAALLQGHPPAGYVAESTRHFAEPAAAGDIDTQSIVIFRIGAEWLALPTPMVTEVANPLTIHSLPHRHGGAVLGLANVRGELLICVSLGQVVGVAASAAAPAEGQAKLYQRLLVIRREHVRVVCPVDEVHGIHHVRSQDLTCVPSTVARAAIAYSSAVLSWRDRSVGILDGQRVFQSLKRCLS